MNMLGSTVYLATDNSRILSREDHDTSQRLAQAFREQGIEIITRAKLKTVKKSKKVSARNSIQRVSNWKVP